MNRIIMDESDLTPEEVAQDELVPGVTPGIPVVNNSVKSRTRVVLQPTNEEKATPKAPK